MSRKFSFLFFLAALGSLPVRAAMTNQTIAATDNDVTLTRLPYYENSAMGDVILSADRTLMVHYDDTGLSTKEYADADSVWRIFTGFEDYDGEGDIGVGSVAQDPAGDDAYYFCMGTVSSLADDNVDERTSIDLAGLFRSTDRLVSARRISSNDFSHVSGLAYADYDALYDSDPRLSRFVLGCAGRNSSRYIYEQDTGIELWWVGARNNHMFAFDPRATVADPSSGETLSRTVYFMSFMQGLFRGEYAADGASITWSNVHKAPAFYDEDAAAWTWDDFRYYEYEPQTNDDGVDGNTVDDHRSRYPVNPEEAGDCDYEIGGVAVYGDYDAANGDCVEEERHGMGAAVVVDAVSVDVARNAATLPAVLYAGYLTNDLWPHGGLFRGIDSGGAVTWTELTHPDDAALPEDERRHLDVRDIVVDEGEAVLLTSGAYAGQYVARYFYVAAGFNGVFRGEVAADGSASLTSLDTGLYTRERFIDDYTGNGSFSGTGKYDIYLCGSTSSCAQYMTVDMGHKSDGTVFLMALDLGGGLYYATDNRADPVTWYRIYLLEGGGGTYGDSTRDGALSASQEAEFDSNTNFSSTLENGMIDDATDELIVPTEYIYKIDGIDTATPGAQTHTVNGVNITHYFASAQFHAFQEGLGDRSGNNIYDPYRPDSRAHQSRLDGSYDYFSWDSEFKMDETYSEKTVEHGYCSKTYYVTDPTSPASLDADGDDVIDVSDSALDVYEVVRKTAYGHSILSAPKKGSSGDYVLFVSSNDHTDTSNGSVYRGDWDSSSGNFKWSLATGDKDCVAKYLASNGDKDSCVYLCDAEGSAATALPQGNPDYLAVDPNDSEHLLVVVYENDATYNLWESKDGGASWSDLSSKYVDASGTSLNSLGVPGDVLIDPTDADVFYVVFGNYGIYRKPAGASSFEDITNDHADDNSNTPTYLSDWSGSKIPYVHDMEAVDDGGQARLYIAVAAFCDSGWSVYPQSSGCGTIDGGGVYTKLVGADTEWTKLNVSGDAKFFAANDLAVSPVNADHIVAVGIGYELDWSGGGNMKDAVAGIMHTTDGGATWVRTTEQIFDARYVAAHPTDANKFIVSADAGGIWELNLDNPDSDGDGVRDDWDDDDSDDDGLRDDIDPNPSRSNTWYWVNSATGTVLAAGDAWDGKPYDFISGTYSGGAITVDGVVDSAKAQSSVFRDCQDSSSSAGTSSSSGFGGGKLSWGGMVKGGALSSILSSRPTSATAPVSSVVSGKISAAKGPGILTGRSGGTYGICILIEDSPLKLGDSFEAGSGVLNSGGGFKKKSGE